MKRIDCEIVRLSNERCHHVYRSELFFFKKAKNFLFQNNIQFEQKDINVDAVARAELQRRNIRGVPAFLIGKDFITGFEPTKILKLIDHRVVECKKCPTKIRVPINKGNLKIKCPQCAIEFDVDTQI